MLCSERWLRVGTLEEKVLDVEVPLRIITGDGDVKREKLMTERDKYKSVQSVFGMFTSELTDVPDETFHAALDQFS